MTPAATIHAGLPLQVSSFAAWREAARELLAHGIAPDAVRWAAPGEASSGAPATAAPPHNALVQLPQPQAVRRLPRSLLALLRSAAGCRVSDRWDFLYRVLWRWQRGERALLSAHDADGVRLRAMARAVHREEIDMHATIRFRERPAEAGPPRFVAWCEPRHDVLAQLAEHYVSVMGALSWMIATPEASVLWDGTTLHNCGAPLSGAAGLAADEAPWLAWYRSIFNPARLQLPLLRHAAPPAWRAGWPAAPGCAAAAVPALPPAAPALAAPDATVAGPALPAAASAPAPARAAAARPPAPAAAAASASGDAGDQPARLEDCRRCDLWRHATQAVGGEGPKRAKIMLVGEQPGDQEDLAGQPFVGPAGKLLDRVCEQAGIDRRAVYVTNAVKHFKWEPRGKRRMHKTPAQREVEACAYWLDKELARVRPAVVVAMGTTALKSVLGASHVTLKDALGRPLRHDGRWVVAIYHPSYALRVPDQAARHAAFASMVEGMRLAKDLLERPPTPDAR